MTQRDELVPIGEAARLLGVAPSALRYYDERGIVRPACRIAGRRMYGRRELRQLAFLNLTQRMGVDLDTIAATLNDSASSWQTVAEAQLARLDALIARAQQARQLLVHARQCPHPRPWQDCPYLIEVLDAWLAGDRRPDLFAEPPPPHAATERTR